jgi:hypothetical protein
MKVLSIKLADRFVTKKASRSIAKTNFKTPDCCCCLTALTVLWMVTMPWARDEDVEVPRDGALRSNGGVLAAHDVVILPSSLGEEGFFFG